jgi:acyl-CoA thioesterase I
MFDRMVSLFQGFHPGHTLFMSINNHHFNRLFPTLILLFVSVLFTAQNVKAQDQYTVLFLGDSLTEGYGLEDGESFPSLIENKLEADGLEHIQVINAGISGSTSASGLSRLQWYIRSRPDLLVLALGANDGLRGLSVDEMKANLTETIDYARNSNLSVVLTGMLIPPNYGPEYTEAFASVFTDLASEYNIPLMPFLLQDVAAIPELNQSDGIHPNVEGTKIVADNLYQFLLPLLPSI